MKVLVQIYNLCYFHCRLSQYQALDVLLEMSCSFIEFGKKVMTEKLHSVALNMAKNLNGN